jgi:adenylate cyclase
MMPPAQPSRGPSRKALLAEIEALRQHIAALEQEKHDLEVMLEMATDHADDLSETLQQERDDLETMLEITTDHGDINSEALWQERDDLETMLEMATEHADALEADLQNQAEALAQRSQFIRETFGRYVSEEVVAQLLDAPEGFELSGELRKVTILMSDLRGFTALAEHLAPQAVMTFLNRYLEAMVEVILAYRGTIIEILGDGLLVLFGAPLTRADDAERAVACALAMQIRLDATNAPNRRAGLPEIEMGIGIHTGEVVVGHIGSQQRTKYGVVGNAVNLTGRIESYTTGGQILISPTTYAETATILTVSHQLMVAPKGIATSITLYAVSGLEGAHSLCLPTPTETLALLPQALDMRYSVLEGKFAGSTMYGGRVVKLATRMAELHLDQPVAAFSNLKLHVLRPTGERVPGEIFAKVVETLPDDTCRVVIRFTSVSEAARTFLDTMRGYEYHVINRAEQV